MSRELANVLDLCCTWAFCNRNRWKVKTSTYKFHGAGGPRTQGRHMGPRVDGEGPRKTNTPKQANVKSKLPRGGEVDILHWNIICSSLSKVSPVILPVLYTSWHLMYNWVAHPTYKNQNRLCRLIWKHILCSASYRKYLCC